MGTVRPLRSYQRSLTRRSAPTPSSSLTAAERETIKGALHPFYEEISTVAVSRVSALRMANSSHHQLRFQIDPQMHSQLESQSGTYGLLIRFFKDTNGAVHAYWVAILVDSDMRRTDIQWWNDFHVILNGKTVDTRSVRLRCILRSHANTERRVRLPMAHTERCSCRRRFARILSTSPS